MNIRKFALIMFLGLFLFCLQANAQLSTREEPVSFKKNVPTLRANEKIQKILPSIDMKKIEQEDKEDEANGIPPRFGYRHEVNYNLENSGEWVDLPDGDKIWRLEILCSGALSINLLYDKFWIPEGAKFFIYSNDKKHAIGTITSEFVDGTYEKPESFSTGILLGENVTLEYYQPVTVTELPIVEINRIDYGYRFMDKIIDAVKPSKSDNSFQDFGEADYCDIKH